MPLGFKAGGRVKGTPNKLTSRMREIAMNSLERVGGEDYLISVAETDPKAYLAFIGRFVPSEMLASVHAQVDTEVSFVTVHEAVPVIETAPILVPVTVLGDLTPEPSLSEPE